MRPLYPVFVLLVMFATCLQGQNHLTVEGRYLKDPNGDTLVLRGANAMTKYWDTDGAKAFPELAATNANAVRIFWDTNDQRPLSGLEASIQRARDLGMVPIPSVWDATGDWSELDACVDWWLSDAVVDMVMRHHEYLLVNIANEAGTQSVSKDEWESTYRSIITRFRDAGITAPLVIDAAHWGRDESYLLERGPALLEHDPEHNLIFSWHPWDPNQPASRYENAMEEAIDLGLCLLVGEFSHQGVQYRQPIDWQSIITLAQEHEIGWLYWCWRGASPDDGHGITTQYGWNSFNQWGWDVSVGHAYSIYNTSVRTPWLGENVNTAPMSYERWQSFAFSPDTQDTGVEMDMDADPDEDYISNAWEWAFMWSPIEANSEPLVQVVSNPTEGTFALRFPEPHLPPETLWLESSTDLTTWTTLDTTPSEANEEGFRQQPISAQPNQYYRWRLDLE